MINEAIVEQAALGWLLGLVLARVPRFTRRPQVNLVAGILYALLIIIPWFLALSAL